MDKKITLKMLPSKNIIISVENGNSITISKEHRNVKADDIFELIDFSRGDKITVESENEKGVDIPVLKFFEELICDIAKKLNRIENTDDEYLN